MLFLICPWTWQGYSEVPGRNERSFVVQRFIIRFPSAFRQQNSTGAFEVRARAAPGARPAAFLVLFAALVLRLVRDLHRVRQRKVQNHLHTVRFLRPGTRRNNRVGKADTW